MAFTFVDLFAGIGGFHYVMDALGGECVFASEIDEQAAAVYSRNWGVEPAGDIVALTDPEVLVPRHDVLCAGFPCQPFSKSGFQRGVAETRGTLFWNICRILEERRPPVIVLENVRNLAGPRHRSTWETIIRSLRNLGYWVADEPAVFSPHFLPPTMGGTPQVRDRVFIIGFQTQGRPFPSEFDPPRVQRAPVEGWDVQAWDVERDLPLEPDSSIPDLAAYRLTAEEEGWINVWDDLLARLDCATLPGFPIWGDDLCVEPRIEAGMPQWKRGFLMKNAAFYVANRGVIEPWLRRHDGLRELPPSRRKLEWQAQDTERSLRNCLLHFRPAFVRRSRRTCPP